MPNLRIFKFKDELFFLKSFICFIPLLFNVFIYLTGNVNYGGIFETGKYTSVALQWMDVNSTETLIPSRLPGYPAFIYLVFQIFGANNFTALLLIQSIVGCVTFYLIIKILEELNLDNNIIIISTLAFNFAIIFRFSLFLPNFFFIFILTLSIFFFTKFYMNQKFIYFFSFSFFFAVLFLIRPIIQYAIFITYPLIIFYLIRLQKGSYFKILCITSLLTFYLISIGTQYSRSYNYDKSLLYTSQSGVHMFWVISCLSKKFACGSRDMEVFRNLQERTQTRISKLDDVNLEKINSIRIDVAKNYILYDMDKEKATYAALVSYVKLIFHSTFIEIFGALGIKASPLYISGEDNFFMKLKNIITNTFTDKYTGIYVIAVLMIFLSRFIQLFGFSLTIRSKNLRMYGLIISSIIFIILATGIGLGNPRYRSEAEPLLIILGAIGLKGLTEKLKSKI